MSLRRYYQLSLAVPIVLPVCAYVLFWSLWGKDGPRLLGSITMLLATSVSVGGLTYVLFAGVVLFALRRKSASDFHRYSLIAPVHYAVALAASCILSVLVEVGVGAMADALGAAIFLGVCAVLLGYVYVGLTHVARSALQSAGILSVGPAGVE